MPHLVSKSKIILSKVLLIVLGYCYAEFQSHVRMIGCHQLSSESRNKHHGFLGHVLIPQLAKFKFIPGFQRLLADSLHFEF